MKPLTPEHPRWEEFLDILSGEKYCDFKEKEDGVPESITWKCRGDLSFSTEIMKNFTDIDIEATIEYFVNHGGFCDCEVIFNIA